MSRFARSGLVCLILLAISVSTVVVSSQRKPLLILYHRTEMTRHWQNNLREHRLNAGVGPIGVTSSFLEAQFHLTALVGLGYFTEHRFPIASIDPTSRRFQELGKAVLETSQEVPVAEWRYDHSRTPAKLLGITVYATAPQITNWQALLSPYASPGY